MTGIGRVCGVSDSSAPSSTTVCTPSSRMISRISSQKPRQRMLGSMPRISTTSWLAPGGRHTENRVVGHSTRRVTPSTSETVGRFTWKS